MYTIRHTHKPPQPKAVEWPAGRYFGVDIDAVRANELRKGYKVKGVSVTYSFVCAGEEMYKAGAAPQGMFDAVAIEQCHNIYTSENERLKTEIKSESKKGEVMKNRTVKNYYARLTAICSNLRANWIKAKEELETVAQEYEESKNDPGVSIAEKAIITGLYEQQKIKYEAAMQIIKDRTIDNIKELKNDYKMFLDKLYSVNPADVDRDTFDIIKMDMVSENDLLPLINRYSQNPTMLRAIVKCGENIGTRTARAAVGTVGNLDAAPDMKALNDICGMVTSVFEMEPKRAHIRVSNIMEVAEIGENIANEHKFKDKEVATDEE